MRKILFGLPVLVLCIAGGTYGRKIVTTVANNNPPPAGAILDLNGTPVPGGGNGTFQAYSVNFVANLTNTQITFAFREDPAYLFVENFSVTDLTVPSGNLLVDGNLTAGTNGSNSPPGWTYANVFGASASGVVDIPCSQSGGPNNAACWDDGAVQAYDALTQVIPTVIGHTYQITFSLADNSDCGCNFSRLSSAGVDGIDMTVYAQAGLPTAGGAPTTPAPPSFWLLLTGIGFFGLLKLRNRFA